MKILVSSKYLGIVLSKHQEDLEKIEYAEFVRGELLLWAGGGFIHINATLLPSSEIEIVSQKVVRWNWIRNTVVSLPEQPIILELHDNSAQIILQF